MHICRAINDLVEAKIVEMDPCSGFMKALPEAHHMTKHVVKFKTMKLLMAFDSNYDMKQVWQNYVEPFNDVMRY
jgi:hypothetical protein